MKEKIFATVLTICFLLAGCTPSEGEKYSISPIEDSSSDPVSLEEPQDDGDSLWVSSDPNAVVELIEYSDPSYYDAQPDPNEIILDYGDKRIRVPGFTREDNVSCVFVNEVVAAVAWHSQYDDLDSIWVKTSGDQGATWTLCEISSVGMEKVEHMYISFDQNGKGILVIECEGNSLHFFRTLDMGNSWNLDESISTQNIEPYGIVTYTNGIYIYSWDDLWKLQDNGMWEKVSFPKITEPYEDLKIDSVKSDGKITLIIMMLKPDDESPWKDLYFVSEDNGQTWHQYLYTNTED